MDKLAKLGVPAFAASVAALGLQQLLYLDFVPGPLIAPPWLPWRAFWAVLVGLALVAAAVAVATPRVSRQGGQALALVLLAVVVAFHLPAPAAVLGDGVARTRACEALGLCAAASVLGGVPRAVVGRLTFALCMAVFGVQHFLYAPFVATLVPAWIPGGGLFWTELTGVAFLAVAVSLAVGRYTRLATGLLGLMFLLWVLVLHAPRVAGRIHDGNEWNSLFVALAFAGASWMLTPAGRPRS